MSGQALRPFLAELRERGELVSVDAEVDLVHELSAYLSLLDRGPAVRFERVKGHHLPVVGNVLATRARIAAGLRTTPAALQRTLVDAIARPIAPRIVPADFPHEVVIDDPDLAALPVPRFFEREGGPYLTAAAIVARHPETGRRNWSIARLRLLGRNRLMAGIAPNHHLAQLARVAQARGERLQIAIVVGLHPALLVAACLYLELGEDELGVAGSLLGEPVALARCARVALEAPAHAEIVLEASLDPEELVEEGPVSEFHGLYETYGAGHVVTVHRLLRRADSPLQVVEPGRHAEHMLLGGVAIAAGLVRELRRHVPSVAAVEVGEGGFGRLAAVVALGPHRPGEPRRAMASALAAVNLLKLVVVVDEDVDVLDAVAVQQAVSLCTRPERDLLVIADARADRAEPLERDGLVGKLGIDATRRASDRDWTEARPPADVLERARQALARAGLLA